MPYEDATREWITRFKYPKRGLAGIDPAADAVARYWIQRAALSVPGDPPDAIVPIPLHVGRLRERGFNQSTQLARDAARLVGSRCLPVALERVRPTESQTELSRAGRRRNVAGAFALKSRVPKRIWLVDDVVTTGATLISAARLLRRSGAREIRAVTLAWRPWIG